jgi:hypothetical protein
MLLPDPSVAPDRWTQCSLELRNIATVTGHCEACPGRPRFAGVDYREWRHTQFEHHPRCRCTDERISAHLRHRGLQMESEKYLAFVVDLESGHWALEGVA